MIVDLETDVRYRHILADLQKVLDWAREVLAGRATEHDRPAGVYMCINKLHELAQQISDEPLVGGIVPEKTIAGKVIPEHGLLLDGHHRALVRLVLGLPVLVKIQD